MNFIEELEWRGMIHTVMPGTDEQLKKEMTTAYVGDPTADSIAYRPFGECDDARIFSGQATNPWLWLEAPPE